MFDECSMYIDLFTPYDIFNQNEAQQWTPVSSSLHKWLDAWGYSDSRGALHLSEAELPASHPYRSEIANLLDPQGAIRAHAIFDVDGVPTVCFLERSGTVCDDDALVRAVRERAWNQNLVSVVLVVDDQRAIAAPTALPGAKIQTLSFAEAKRFGEFSCADVQSGDLFGRHADWFAAENRVDRVLLHNLGLTVEALVSEGLGKTNAQLLMAQVMFVAYLEHRGIVGDTYRKEHGVGTLSGLVHAKDRGGIVRLLESLKQDFNGDVLEPVGAKTVWNELSAQALSLLDDFLSRVNLEDGQRDFWHYDFRFIPVELISGIYESFLSDEKRAAGAYYTPRNLATLAVDQAFHGSADILSERVYDGACGSGILLTTAFRRMLAHGESISGRQWDFAERVDLLKRSIFGSDLNKSACRVTAFSLYLSVLENLKPADIAKLTAEGKSKLPNMAENNIFFEEKGDFFSDSNPLATRKDFTLFLSNPPWVEPEATSVLSSDEWAKREGYAIPRRQMCAAFMLRALDSVHPENGRFCFILPVSVLAAATSQKFVNAWLDQCEIDTVINFGDLRKLLFDNAKQPTLVVVANPRRKNQPSRTPETFEYWTPKADVSFAFGRLSLHGADRNVLQTSQLRSDNAILTNLFWGTPQDLALMARLEMSGQIKDVLERTGWRTSKGFHKKDRHVDAEDLVSVEPIRHLSYLNARQFAMDGPLLDEGTLERFPENVSHVPNLTDELVATFVGPRIVFKDGMSPEREVCAAFSSKAFCFNSSTGVITAPEQDVDILRFLSVYLHSDLVRYLLLLSAYQVSFERERVALHDIKHLPFGHPEDHAKPKRAAEIISEIAAWVKQMEAAPQIARSHMYAGWKHKAEVLIDEYFGLTTMERSRIKEVVALVLPSVQPSSLGNLITPLQQRVQDTDLRHYVHTLLHELAQWRDALGGKGSFAADLTVSSAQTCGALGILRLDVAPHKDGHANVPAHVADDAVAAFIQRMRMKGLLPVQLQGNFYLAADIVIRHENSLYLVKPLVRRLWLQAEAVRDAERVVRHVQSVAVA